MLHVQEERRTHQPSFAPLQSSIGFQSFWDIVSHASTSGGVVGQLEGWFGSHCCIDAWRMVPLFDVVHLGKTNARMVIELKTMMFKTLYE